MERDLKTFTHTLTDLFNPIMFLKAAVKEGGGKGIAVKDLGLLGGGFQSNGITGPTPIRTPGMGPVEEKPQVVPVVKNNL